MGTGGLVGERNPYAVRNARHPTGIFLKAGLVKLNFVIFVVQQTFLFQKSELLLAWAVVTILSAKNAYRK